MHYSLLNSLDEKVACKKIMEKKGLKGYQVNSEHDLVTSLFDIFYILLCLGTSARYHYL